MVRVQNADRQFVQGNRTDPETFKKEEDFCRSNRLISNLNIKIEKHNAKHPKWFSRYKKWFKNTSENVYLNKNVQEKKSVKQKNDIIFP